MNENIIGLGFLFRNLIKHSDGRYSASAGGKYSNIEVWADTPEEAIYELIEELKSRGLYEDPE